ncbi:hypothetical protein D7316_03833 [Gordonia insulae]|uniref:HTH marR-type domain-containing protein n=2 Tax=Gordonia insulae TaxID=2420509 RepID=A0A3G8JR80_9ACTN|nr:hypothetical protein [Gordonia insulae]AZG47225.1 hypothetical protein D7316_03833 [Gordonia insulae]
MQPPLQQPIGFWTARAGEAIRTRTQSRLADVAVSQPEWWVLHQLSLHTAGMGEREMLATIGPNATDEIIAQAIDDAISKGWVERADGALTSTAAGRERFAVAADVQRELNAERRQGISDADYATTIEVLQRTIRNVGGDAWHW